MHNYKENFRKIRRNMQEFKTRMQKPKKGKGSNFNRNGWKLGLSANND